MPMTDAVLPRPARLAGLPSLSRACAMLRLGAGALLTASLLAGCSLLPATPHSTTYDLGPPTAAPAQGKTLPRLRVLSTDGPSWLDGSAIHYRLRYAQAERLQPYATQRWIMSPVRLFDERLREAVSARGELTWAGDTQAPALKVDIVDFEQVFDSADSSRGVVQVRATVMRNGIIGQKTFTAEQPAPSADGAGGVRALAGSTDAVIAAIIDWVATLPVR